MHHLITAVASMMILMLFLSQFVANVNLFIETIHAERIINGYLEQEYDEDELLNRIGLASNIVTDKILAEQLSRALREGIILQSVSALNGKKIYVLRQDLVQSPTQTEIHFDDDVRPF